MSEPETFSELRELARALPKNVLVPAYHIHSLLDETERLVERIADLERQLAEAEGYPGIAHDFETTRRELEEARTEIADRAHTEEQYRLRIEDLERQLAEKQAEIEAMRTMVEACKTIWHRHNQAYGEWARSIGIDLLMDGQKVGDCPCLTCQWYRDYEARKPK